MANQNNQNNQKQDQQKQQNQGNNTQQASTDRDQSQQRKDAPQRDQSNR